MQLYLVMVSWNYSPHWGLQLRNLFEGRVIVLDPFEVKRNHSVFSLCILHY